MPNAVFAEHRDNVIEGIGPNVGTASIKAMFVDHGTDTPNTAQAGDEFISDILSGARVPAIASAPVLATKTFGTIATGVFDAADTVFPALSGASVESLILFEDSGVETTSDLMTFWDTATGLPFTPNGGDVTVTWNASGIYGF